MIRVFIAAALAATMFTSGLMAAETSKPVGQNGPLQAGKPAGVKAAQAEDATTWWVIGLGAAGIAGVVALTSGESEGAMQQAQIPVTSTST